MKFFIMLVFILMLFGCQNEMSEPPEDVVTMLQNIDNIKSTSYHEELNLIDNKSCGWGFRKLKDAPPEITKNQEESLKNYNAIYRDLSGEKCLYLTFDQGYENGYTKPILDVLKANDVKACFFLTGPYAKEQTELINLMLSGGHILGNHTVNHPVMSKISLSKLEQEISGLDEIIINNYDTERTRFYRPPSGEYSNRSLALVKKLGYTTVMWSLAYKDWETDNQKGADYAYNRIMQQLHPGAILLLHSVSKDNAEALDRVIKSAKDIGYSFKSLDEFKK